MLKKVTGELDGVKEQDRKAKSALDLKKNEVEDLKV